MSGRLVTTVFESALSPWLKPYAAAYASFALDDGSRVYPSLARVARMVGKSDRSTRRAVHELRQLGVLVRVTGPRHHQAPRYTFNAAALPQLGDPDQLALFPQPTTSKPATPDVFHSHPQVLTGHRWPVREDMGVRRSVSDPLFTKKVRRNWNDAGEQAIAQTRRQR